MRYAPLYKRLSALFTWQPLAPLAAAPLTVAPKAAAYFFALLNTRWHIFPASVPPARGWRFLLSCSRSAYFINLMWLWRRWGTYFGLLRHLSDRRLSFFCWGTPSFLSLTLAMNWQMWPASYVQWRTYYTYFFLRKPLSPLTLQSSFIANFFPSASLHFVVDPVYHARIITHLQYHQRPLLAPASIAVEPWAYYYTLPCAASAWPLLSLLTLATLTPGSGQ